MNKVQHVKWCMKQTKFTSEISYPTDSCLVQLQSIRMMTEMRQICLSLKTKVSSIQCSLHRVLNHFLLKCKTTDLLCGSYETIVFRKFHHIMCFNYVPGGSSSCCSQRLLLPFKSLFARNSSIFKTENKIYINEITCLTRWILPTVLDSCLGSWPAQLFPVLCVIPLLSHDYGLTKQISKTF